MNNNTLEWFENDKLFFDECRKGQKWQEYVGRYIEKRGLEVNMPELSFRSNPNVADFSEDDAGRFALARKKQEMARKEFVNSKDIVIVPNIIIEVKSRRLKFTSQKDFPYSTVIIDTVSGYNQKDPKPILYVSVSRDTGAMIATRGRCPERWSNRKVFDKVRRIKETNYECGLEYWRPLDDYLEVIVNHNET